MHLISRHRQDQLAEINPQWAAYAEELTRTGTEPRSNPDGDVELKHQSYSSFKLPDCQKCGKALLKPSVSASFLLACWAIIQYLHRIFFGENVSSHDKEYSLEMVENASSLVVCGSSLATFSAYRLVKNAAERGIPVALLNLGPSRGDPLITPGLRLDLPVIDVLPRTATLLAGTQARFDPVLKQILSSGVVTPTQNHPDDHPAE